MPPFKGYIMRPAVPLVPPSGLGWILVAVPGHGQYPQRGETGFMTEDDAIASETERWAAAEGTAEPRTEGLADRRYLHGCYGCSKWLFLWVIQVSIGYINGHFIQAHYQWRPVQRNKDVGLCRSYAWAKSQSATLHLLLNLWM